MLLYYCSYYVIFTAEIALPIAKVPTVRSCGFLILFEHIDLHSKVGLIAPNKPPHPSLWIHPIGPEGQERVTGELGWGQRKGEL